MRLQAIIFAVVLVTFASFVPATAVIDPVEEPPLVVSEGEKQALLPDEMALLQGQPSPGYNCEVNPWNARSTQRIWNQGAQVFQDGGTWLGDRDILVLGDSQVWNQSWVAQGIRHAGFNPVMYRCGGIGFVRWRPGYSGSYFGGVIHNEWDLPSGKPRAIYIQGSGNDSYIESDRLEAARRVTPVVAKLRQLYPGTQIILTGPLGSNFPSQAHRFDLNEKLSSAARANDLTFISYERWATDYGVQWALPDSLHFSDQYQYLLAPAMSMSLQAALRGNTLKGAVQTYVSSHGGSQVLGVPTSNETGSIDGGVWQSFSKNTSMYWSTFSGTHRVKWNGAIGHKYESVDYERGIGYPAEDETAYAYGFRQVFLKGNGAESRMYWAANTGAHAMNGRGAIFAKWVGSGHAQSLGFPLTDEIWRGGGAIQYFRASNGGETGIYWSESTGAHQLNSKGAIYYQYLRGGYISKYGFPVTDEYTDAWGVTQVRFSSGHVIRWTATRGVWVSVG